MGLDALGDKDVVITKAAVAAYPLQAPFSPHEHYPEVLFKARASEYNPVYDAIRACFRIAGLDRENYGTPAWNPLRGLIRPGETVLLKPNLVKESHPRDPEGWRYVLTHGSVIRAVADYVWKALQGQGTIVVADAPQTDSSFDAIARILGLDVLRDFYAAERLPLELLDLRQKEWVSQDGVVVGRHRRPGDPRGYVAFNLGEASEFVGHHGAGRYYGADYDAGEVNRHHDGGCHEYLVSATAVQCDVVFSLPKLKTHKKAGISVGLKNLVGINGDKNWLPHYTKGSPAEGGDEHPWPDAKHRVERRSVEFFHLLSRRLPGLGSWVHRRARRLGERLFGETEEVIRSGNWWGNETTWRMCLDLNKIIAYGDRDGTLRPGRAENRRRHCVLVDGIIAGEGRGPMNPDPVPAGIVVLGTCPASVDAACAYLMGYDPELIPLVRQAFRCRHYPLTEWGWPDVRIISSRPEWNGRLEEISDHSTFHFEPHFGWKGHIERRGKLGGAEQGGS